MKILMRRRDREPTLKEILSDSVTREVMEADHVDPRELEEMLSVVAGRLGAVRRAGERCWAD
jgi:hypothetical protein